MSARALKVDDALQYLDKVKNALSDRRRYDDFLKIMKEFRSGTLVTAEVIARVKVLFKGKPALLVGFRAFLPQGYTLELDAEEQEQWDREQQGREPGMEAEEAQDPIAPPAVPEAPQAAPDIVPPGSPIGSPQAGREGGRGGGRGGRGAAAAGARDAGGAPASSPQQQQQQQQELPHAISYVTKVKKRFVEEPDTYKAFLRTLHAYQRKEKNIKDVLSEVCSLFSEHPDLLYGFAYFLPDGVQDTARDRFAAVVAEYETRHAHSPPGLEEAMQGPPGPAGTSLAQQGVAAAVAEQQKGKEDGPVDGSAVAYVRHVKLKLTLSGHDFRYRAFLALLRAYKAGEKGVAQVVEGMAGVMADHPHLLRGFIPFLPEHKRAAAEERFEAVRQAYEARRAAAEAEARAPAPQPEEEELAGLVEGMNAGGSEQAERG